VYTAGPRAFRDPAVLAERLAMVETTERSMELQRWASELEVRRTAAARATAVVPRFDPADAGVEARVLILLEAPGPMTNAENVRPGSGFISVDNDDLTAANCWIARNEAGLHEGVIQWNIVPWYLGVASKKPTADELARGAMELRRLLPLLPELRAVVLSGKFAQAGWAKHVAPFAGSTLRTIETWHPSPLSLNQPGHRADFGDALRKAAHYL